MGARTLRIALLEGLERPLPFGRDLLACITEEVHVVGLDNLVTRNPHLLVIARATWSEADTALCARVDAARTGVPLLAIGGVTPVALRTEALRAGADEFISVPFDIDEVPARAFALLRLSTRGGVLRAGAFVVEPARRRVFVGGVAIPLTLSEYDVLASLVGSAGEVVGRRTLASSGGSTASSESNIVDVLVSRIREKLGTHARAIETVRGVGYRFRGS